MSERALLCLDCRIGVWTTLEECIAYSGKWRLSVFYGALDKLMDIEWPAQWYGPGPEECACNIPDPEHYKDADERWDRVREKLEVWIRQAPKSPHARVALAQMLVNRAWFYRGNGYAATVRPEAWPLFERYLEESRKVLEDHGWRHLQGRHA